MLQQMPCRQISTKDDIGADIKTAEVVMGTVDHRDLVIFRLDNLRAQRKSDNTYRPFIRKDIL